MDYFFCYDAQVARYLRYDRGINFITRAINPNSSKVFYLFLRNNQLDQALKKYQKPTIID